MKKLRFLNLQILKQSITTFLAVTFLFISLTAKAEHEVNIGDSTEYLTSLDSNFSDTFQAVQPKIRVINPAQFQLQLLTCVDQNLYSLRDLLFTKDFILPQVLGVHAHLQTILEFVICTNAP